MVATAVAAAMASLDSSRSCRAVDRRLAARRQLLAAQHLLPAARRQIPVARCQLIAARHQLQAARCAPEAIHACLPVGPYAAAAAAHSATAVVVPPRVTSLCSTRPNPSRLCRQLLWGGGRGERGGGSRTDANHQRQHRHQSQPPEHNPQRQPQALPPAPLSPPPPSSSPLPRLLLWGGRWRGRGVGHREKEQSCRLLFLSLTPAFAIRGGGVEGVAVRILQGLPWVGKGLEEGRGGGGAVLGGG
ncbi:unnamed protein product [Closterium sp. NIES-54]